ncbi:AraC family transcriptional regulator [Cupriavidus neocaledonicus]|uniref:HTH araC/xylS-type domain-containing protein n=1 Tax=Cupriavidus neocaledonicus TaxID=1040979 RepID=A0A375HPS2_9BURK|nr:helix-turn-helix domain-containing protein [Cupriavidus neocaledonicus]SOZ39430.1 conserved hypothetical protein [Cupriavidus neocaledonicus]SPD58854.1 conserved protein of unknown function [Cupriavidus neocaledonicus]
MAALTHHSPKLHLTAERGFALHESRHAGFRREWHTHDCSMLLWTRAGRLRSVWESQPDTPQPGPVAATLVRGGAVLLPASTRHFTAAEAGRQHHGELYLPPDRLRSAAPYGALRLDGAALAMLEALLTPGLAPASAELLVRAIVGQIMASPLLALPQEPASLALRLVRCFSAALERDQALPSIDAAACTLGASARQLQRACQLEFGASPVTVRRRVLAAHARSLLAEGLPLARVSERLGFASSGHLVRLLREVPPAR